MKSRGERSYYQEILEKRFCESVVARNLYQEKTTKVTHKTLHIDHLITKLVGNPSLIPLHPFSSNIFSSPAQNATGSD
jgi:hypothetical protein